MSRPRRTLSAAEALASDCDRFWSKVDKRGGFPDFTDPLVRVTEADGECWLWTAFEHPMGYGFFRSFARGFSLGAHRVSYFLAHGVWSSRKDGTTIDHLCRRKLCVRPNHLEMVSEKTNALRGAGPTAVNAVKTHCIHGHEFTTENTMPNGDNRKCRECHRRITREWARRNRGDRRAAA